MVITILSREPSSGLFGGLRGVWTRCWGTSYAAAATNKMLLAIAGGDVKFRLRQTATSIIASTDEDTLDRQ
ncbi:hypothetical protein H6F95_07860 [Cyanobacteria bacterium FACHB-471]|nr:hypothetical protein [Cyanobacteria bacterium FACHB-471]